MRFFVATVSFILVGINLLALGLGSQPITIDLRSCLAALCVNSYLCLFFLLGNTRLQNVFRTWFTRSHLRTLSFVVMLWISYWVYAGATDSLRALPLLKLLVYLTLPPLIFSSTRTLTNRFHWQEIVVALTLWLPLEFGWMTEVWSWPDSQLAYSLNALVGTCVGVFSFVCLRGLDHVGYEWRWQAVDWQTGWRHFLVLCPVALLLGVLSRFIEVSESFASPATLGLMALGIFIFIAVPEELLFRGIIQNILEKEVGHRSLALGVAALIFGAAHLNNGSSPDWRYFLLATLAGWFYGRAYVKTRNLMAPALLHTLVDTVWRGFFR